MKKTIGIFAHVDAGKTTFSEQVLLHLGALRRAGRVDHGDTLLDSHPLERSRGITIFSGQAVVRVGEDTLYWLDTPGHPDFISEAERALPVLDYAILVLSCADGIQSHTETLWRLLAHRQVPVFLFLNKCDLPSADADAVLSRLADRFSPDIADFRCFQRTGGPDEALREMAALRDDDLMERYLEGAVREEEWLPALTQLIRQRKLFPVLSGSALKDEGIDTFLSCLLALTQTDYEARTDAPLALRCWRLRHTDGQRICFVKLESGHLSPKDTLPDTGEKIHSLFFCHGDALHPAASACAGDLVAVAGLSSLRPGDCVGRLPALPGIEPMTESDLIWDEKAVPPFRMLEHLRELEEEDPSLRVYAGDGRLSVRASGKLQLEILAALIEERWNLSVSFGPARVLYRETVAAPVVGIGHYEPLRHYAEVHLRLSPAPRGSGIRFVSLCSVNDLALNWQRLIETHVFEREHKGVLTGAPLTDVTVELLCGRAHLKHTEGGDFRQAVGRAMRNALMHAENVLLEPVCRYEIRIPSEMAGRVSASLAQLRAEAEAPVPSGQETLLCGEVRLSRFIPWQDDFPAFTRGRGSLSVAFSRYTPCEPRDQADIVAARQYNPLADDTPDSVFCAHGAGYTVSWDKVKDFAHCAYKPA